MSDSPIARPSPEELVQRASQLRANAERLAQEAKWIREQMHEGTEGFPPGTSGAGSLDDNLSFPLHHQDND